MSRATGHPSKVKKVYEVEQELKDDGYFVFRKTQPHGLFHVLGFSPNKIKMVQVLRLYKFNFNDINKELVKVQDFAFSGRAPRQFIETELWVWVNNKGWIKYAMDENGDFEKFEDYGTNDFRKKGNKERESV